MARKQADDFDPPSEPIWELGLLDFIERASGGHYKAPIHFRKIVEAIERAEKLLSSRDVFAAPVQHGKTTLIEFAIAWLLLRHPDRAIIYLTYAQRKAEKHSRRIRRIYQECGGRLQADFNTIQEWKTEAGGGLLVTSRDGEITGNPAVHVFFDDPYKDRAEAESAETRELLEDKYSSEIVTRVAPGGSIQIIASRWHVDDLSGTRVRDGYQHVHLKAIDLAPTLDDHGEPETDDFGNVVMHEIALCPWGPDPRYPRDLSFLLSIRDGKDVTAYDWSSLYQGEPKPPGGGMFQGVHLVRADEMPAIVKFVPGGDFAYSVSGDRIALVGTAVCADGDLYIVKVGVWQASILEKLGDVRVWLFDFADENGRTPAIASYMSGPEIGTAKAMSQIEMSAGGPIRVDVMSAKYNKIVRAAKCARRWNARGIHVVADQDWTADFVRRVVGFTGLEGDRDDEVDALVSAHDRHFGAGSLKAPTGGFKRGARVM